MTPKTGYVVEPLDPKGGREDVKVKDASNIAYFYGSTLMTSFV
jgi:hypothetical protein